MRRTKTLNLALISIMAAFFLIGHRLPPPASAADSQALTARLGVSAGDAIGALALGSDGEPLRLQIPLLWTTAERLGISVTSASVGQGFWSEDGRLGSEKDLDLVVSGHRESIEALAATLGSAWGQSTVYVWYPMQELGRQTTATIPLPGGASQLTDDIYREMVPQITGGAHVKYAGADSLIFIAKTDDAEPDDAFSYRMMRLAETLTAAGVATGPIECGRADVTVQTRATYERFVGQAPQTPVQVGERGSSGTVVP